MFKNYFSKENRRWWGNIMDGKIEHKMEVQSFVWSWIIQWKLIINQTSCFNIFFRPLYIHINLFYLEVTLQVLLKAWVRCFLLYAFLRTTIHSTRWWNLDFIRLGTTLKHELSLTCITIGNPLPESSKSCMFLPAPYMGLFFVPNCNVKIVKPLSA